MALHKSIKFVKVFSLKGFLLYSTTHAVINKYVLVIMTVHTYMHTVFITPRACARGTVVIVCVCLCVCVSVTTLATTYLVYKSRIRCYKVP